jgi:hypothetical protein
MIVQHVVNERTRWYRPFEHDTDSNLNLSPEIWLITPMINGVFANPSYKNLVHEPGFAILHYLQQ